MSETLEYVNHLSRTIGPRPAGTEEERQAAEYIADTLEARSGMPVEIEDFKSAAGAEAPHAICMGIAVVAGLFSLFSSIFGIPALVLLVVATVLLVLEHRGNPVILNLLSRGASQNVVAKYQPGIIFDEGRGRKRKIVVVAHYDSGKVRNELIAPVLKVLPIVQRASFWSVPAMLVLVLIRSILLGGDTGIVGTIFAVLIVVAIILSLVPLVLTLLHKVSPYNEAANSNAAGVAAMMEVANRVGRGRMSEEEIEYLAQFGNQDDQTEQAPAPKIHGAQEAVEAGVVPEGAEIHYEPQPVIEFVGGPTTAPEQPQAYAPRPAESAETGSASARLLAAKAAIAAMTGAAVSEAVYAEPTPDPVDEEAVQAAAAIPEEAQPVIFEEPVAHAEDERRFEYTTAQPSAPSTPDWFVAAQMKAKANKPVRGQDGNVKRSRYADALDAAVSASAVHFDEANQEALTGMDAQIERFNDGIVEVKAPGYEEQPVSELQSPAEPVAAEPVVGHADNDILAGVVEGIDMGEAPVLDMPAFLTGELPVQSAGDGGSRTTKRVAVSAYTDQDALSESESGDVQELVEPVAVESVSVDVVEVEEPAPDFVGQVTDDFVPHAMGGDPEGSMSMRLPTVSLGETDSFAAVGSGQKQRAPLADEKSTAKSLLSMLPSIDPADPKKSSNTANIADLAATLPSLSGTIPAATGSQTNGGSAGATGVFAPVTEEIVKSAGDEEDLFIDDADDSDYQENFTESGAFAGPDYVEMPKAPVRNFFDKLFHRGKRKQAQVDEMEGSYADEQWDEEYVEGDYQDDDYRDEEYQEDWNQDEWDRDGGFQDDIDDEFFGGPEGSKKANGDKDEFTRNGERWNGGAFSALKGAASSVGGKASQAAQGVAGKAKSLRHGESDAPEDNPPAQRRGRFSAMIDDPTIGYESSPRAKYEEGQRQARVAEGALAEGVEPGEAELPEQYDQVEAFRNPYVNAEVWFVALGSELAGDAGMRAFLDAHAPELRGAIIVELDALGEGTLSMVETEGSLKKVATSSRMKRYMRKVAQATGVKCASAHFDWNDSASSYANSHGFSAMHLVGADGSKPALFGQEDDVVESIDEQKLETNVECVMELLHTI